MNGTISKCYECYQDLNLTIIYFKPAQAPPLPLVDTVCPST